MTRFVKDDTKKAEEVEGIGVDNIVGMDVAKDDLLAHDCAGLPWQHEEKLVACTCWNHGCGSWPPPPLTATRHIARSGENWDIFIVSRFTPWDTTWSLVAKQVMR